MVEVGDKVLVVSLASGQRVAIPARRPIVGNKVLVIPLASGQRIAIPIIKPKVGDKAVVMALSSGQRMAFNAGKRGCILNTIFLEHIFRYTRSEGNGEYDGCFIDTETRPDSCIGEAKELYFEKESEGTPSWARTTGTIETSHTRLTGWVGVHVSDIPLRGGVRIKVGENTVWQKTEAQFGGSGVLWVPVDIDLNSGDPISDFVLQFERYHSQSFHTRFSAYFCGIQLR